MQQPKRILSVLVAAVLIATTPAATPVYATAPCSDAGWVNRFDGFYTGYSPTYSVRGSLVDRAVALCSNTPGATSGASAWLMVAGGATSGLEYAQIGYANIAGQVASRFVEYNDGESASGWARIWYGGYSIGTNHFYEVLFSFGPPPRKISLRVDGVTKAVTPWSPEGGVWHVGWTGQYFGETLDAGDDVPGTLAAKANFTNVKAITCWGCGWVSPPSPQVFSNHPAYKFAWVTYPTYFDIWTQR